MVQVINRTNKITFILNFFLEFKKVNNSRKELQKYVFNNMLTYEKCFNFKG